MQEELQKVIIGQDEVIEQLFAAIFTRGHCLLEGVPGLAKTLDGQHLGQILDVGFKRIQFTPDLMPSDITGTNVLEENEHGRREFPLRRGADLHQHPAGRRNQPHPAEDPGRLAAGHAGARGFRRAADLQLPEPFFVIATQNPIEQEGTYPLPEAQLDRFMFNIKVDYPTLDEEERILTSTTPRTKCRKFGRCSSGKAILNLQKLVTAAWRSSEYVIKYVVAAGARHPAQGPNRPRILS